jgi:hypothetical protein
VTSSVLISSTYCSECCISIHFDGHLTIKWVGPHVIYTRWSSVIDLLHTEHTVYEFLKNLYLSAISLYLAIVSCLIVFSRSFYYSMSSYVRLIWSFYSSSDSLSSICRVVIFICHIGLSLNANDGLIIIFLIHNGYKTNLFSV